MQPLGAASRDGNEVLARLRQHLNDFLMVGQKILQQNHPAGTENVLAQLNEALGGVAIAGFAFYTLNEKLRFLVKIFGLKVKVFGENLRIKTLGFGGNLRIKSSGFRWKSSD